MTEKSATYTCTRGLFSKMLDGAYVLLLDELYLALATIWNDNDTIVIYFLKIFLAKPDYGLHG